MTGPDTTSIVTPVLIATIPGLLAFLAAFHIHTHRPGRALRWALLSASISSGCWWFSGTLIAQVNPAIGGALLTFAVLTSFYGYYMIKQARVRDLHPGLAWIATGAERARLWEEALKFWPPYADYQQKTEREIPVVVLDPVR
jgi:hypothetical protein